jgi:hypothetical protein
MRHADSTSSASRACCQLEATLNQLSSHAASQFSGILISGAGAAEVNCTAAGPITSIIMAECGLQMGVSTSTCRTTTCRTKNKSMHLKFVERYEIPNC